MISGWGVGLADNINMPTTVLTKAHGVGLVGAQDGTSYTTPCSLFSVMQHTCT